MPRESLQRDEQDDIAPTQETMPLETPAIDDADVVQRLIQDVHQHQQQHQLAVLESPSKNQPFVMSSQQSVDLLSESPGSGRRYRPVFDQPQTGIKAPVLAKPKLSPNRIKITASPLQSSGERLSFDEDEPKVVLSQQSTSSRGRRLSVSASPGSGERISFDEPIGATKVVRKRSDFAEEDWQLKVSSQVSSTSVSQSPYRQGAKAQPVRSQPSSLDDSQPIGPLRTYKAKVLTPKTPKRILRIEDSESEDDVAIPRNMAVTPKPPIKKQDASVQQPAVKKAIAQQPIAPVAAAGQHAMVVESSQLDEPEEVIFLPSASR
jgi:hypothetical protein